MPGRPLWLLELADDQVRSSTHQVHYELPRTALTGQSEGDAKEVAVTKLLPKFPYSNTTLMGLSYVLLRHLLSQQN